MAKSNLSELKKEAFESNMDVFESGLVVLTCGNPSALGRSQGIFAIKPSGVPYSALKWQDMVLVDLDGKVVDSTLKPSSDTLTHLEIYKGFKNINGIVHTHSEWATVWAQACKSIPVLGTTHSDHFFGDIPCIPYLSESKIVASYEKETGRQIVDFYTKHSLNPQYVPACLLGGHASFTWGETARIAFQNAVALESCAKMAFFTLNLNSKIEFPDYILKKHFTRKHGENAYYGQ